eukprot:TRINITY_DN18269_c0_g2_i1.p1 TRINITY_DN18269_c0_g2~~TRINITY_DN18269_c0_g2_i1.p1  ORF type:complete len:1058 (-),score=253.66 TRINITY_DN18269_c0_g2_i1:105-3278(-)
MEMEDSFKFQALGFGSGALGERFLNHCRDKPTKIDQFNGRQIESFSLGTIHSLIIKPSGAVFGAGDNSEGQISPSCEEIHGIELLDDLENIGKFKNVCVGFSHSIGITEEGAAISFGSNEYGQLGHSYEEKFKVRPKPVVSVHGAVKSACGNEHSLILRSNGHVYAFGDNSRGQLGGEFDEELNAPVLVKSLTPFQIMDIASGSGHNMAITVSGSVLAWGWNKYGQLGINEHTDVVSTPTVVDAPEPMKKVCCGQQHSLLLSKSGKVYACGQGKRGQLGTNIVDDRFSPVIIPSLKNIKVIDIACGDSHSLVLLEDGRVMAFGAGESGQLGNSDSSDAFVPVPVNMPESEEHHVTSIFAGGTLSAMVTVMNESTPSLNPKASPGWSEFEKSIKPISKASSFDTYTCKEFSTAFRNCGNSDERCDLVDRVFGSLSVLSGSFLTIKTSHQLDLKGLDPVFEAILTDNACVKHLYDAIMSICKEFKEVGLEWMKANENALVQHSTIINELYRWFFIIICSPIFRTLKWSHDTILPHIAITILTMPTLVRSYMENSMFKENDLSPSTFQKRFLSTFQEHLTTCVERISPFWQTLEGNKMPPKRAINVLNSLMSMMGIFYGINQRLNLATVDSFFNKGINELPNIALFFHLQIWKKVNTNYNFCIYDYPFLLNAGTKRTALGMEAEQEQIKNSSPTRGFSFMNMRQENLVFNIRRDWLLHDALTAIQSVPPSALKRKLRISFVGEDGLDEGGLKKEFFQLLVEQLFDLQYGMFTYSNDSRTFWFNPASLASGNEFFTLGVLLGLAIYNNVLLDVHFPKTVFKKMVGEKMTLDDMAELQPEVASSLKQLLEYEGDDAEDIFCLTYSATIDTLTGEKQEVDIVPNGRNIPVTSENKKDFVERYVQWVLVDSIESTFDAFLRGFKFMVQKDIRHPPCFDMFTSDDLELVVCGQTELDLTELQSGVKYEGYSANHPTIRMFWDVIGSMSGDNQRKFLLFVTGCAKAPIGGLAGLPFKIQRAGPDTDRLPTAATCFNLLLLPEYSSRTKLQEKIHTAINECTGFGLQ